MNILVFGKNGQVAQELANLKSDNLNIVALGREQVNLFEPTQAEKTILQVKPDVVINAAAWTAVDLAETHQSEAYTLNAEAPLYMAKGCARLGIPLLHISTDYVFDGAGHLPFKPDSKTGPLGVYGSSKLLGEENIKNSGVEHIILRTSWVFSPYGSNFVKTMLRLGAQKDVLRVVADQVGGPTPASGIAETLVFLAKSWGAKKLSGTYHFSGYPDVSWAEFAHEIMKLAHLPCKIEPIPSSEYYTPAKRPANSRLDCSSLFSDFSIERPLWKKYLSIIIKT